MAVERMSEDHRMPIWLRHEHEARYQWAASLVAGKRVIDAACGTGYGASILLEAGATCVDGYDVSTDSIAEANRLHAGRDVTFTVADATDLPCLDGHYEVYLSFETIEHIDDDRAYLREAARVVGPGGLFVCSTPNRDVTNPGTEIVAKPFNPFHVREYSLGELEALLLEFFPLVTVLGQTHRRSRYVRLLHRIGRVWPMLAVRTHQVRKVLGVPREHRERHSPSALRSGFQPEVLVAVCSFNTVGDPD